MVRDGAALHHATVKDVVVATTGEPFRRNRSALARGDPAILGADLARGARYFFIKSPSDTPSNRLRITPYVASNAALTGLARAGGREDAASWPSVPWTAS